MAKFATQTTLNLHPLHVKINNPILISINDFEHHCSILLQTLSGTGHGLFDKLLQSLNELIFVSAVGSFPYSVGPNVDHAVKISLFGIFSYLSKSSQVLCQ